MLKFTSSIEVDNKGKVSIDLTIEGPADLTKGLLENVSDAVDKLAESYDESQKEPEEPTAEPPTQQVPS